METPSGQMNNLQSNMFSENTFTFDANFKNISNELAEALYQYICDRIEEIKYNVKIIDEIPDFNKLVSSDSALKENGQSNSDNVTSDVIKCDLCGSVVEHLARCEIKDELGKRYRNCCDSCIKNRKLKILG